MHRSSFARTVVSVSAFVQSAQALTRAPSVLQVNSLASCSLAGRSAAPRIGRPHRSIAKRSLSSSATMMTPTEKYLFDLNGFIVIRNVLTPAEVAAANAAIDAHQDGFKKRTDDALRNTAKETPFAGDGTTPRMDMGGMLGWPSPHRDVFRKLLAHPKLVPYLRELVGEGYRMDHLPLLIASEKGAEGFALHGGTIDLNGDYVQLVDHPAGSGGFVCIRGSHKANFPTPPQLVNGEEDLEGCLYQPETKAGDVILFSEGTVHGASAWNMDYQRRLVLYRFAPPTVAYARSYLPAYPAEMTDGMTTEQLAVLEPPYNVRLDRPLVKGGEGESEGEGPLEVEVRSRAGPKKEFDKEVFGTKYF